MKFQDLLEKIYQALPDLRDQLHFNHVDYLAGKASATVHFTSDALVEESAFIVTRKILQRAFPKIRVSLRIASPSLAEDFLARPAAYKQVLEPILLKSFPALTPYMKDIRWLSDQGSIVLELPDPYSFEYAGGQEVKQKLACAMEDIFLLKPNIKLRLRDDITKRVERQDAQRKKENELLAEQPAYVTVEPPHHASSPPPKKGKKITGSAIATQAVPIKGLSEVSGKVTIAGKVISVDRRNIKNSNAILLMFVLNDETDSIYCKVFLGSRKNGFRGDMPAADPEAEKKKAEEAASRIIPGIGLKVRGDCQVDPFDKALVLMAQDINAFDLARRTDLEKHKRVELHAHTHMSYMDGLVSAEKLIQRAAEFGHQAIAITDHGVVQAYPEAFAAAKKNKIKLIPGMEGTMMDDTGIVHMPGTATLDEPIVVLDFETTGLNPQVDRIIEIGAVKIQHGQIIDSFSMLVNPGIHLSDDTTRITGIKNHMVMNEPKADAALPQLMAFIGSHPVAAHNAAFDMGFLKNELARLGEEFECAQIDTVTFAQKLYPLLKRYKLSALCKHLGVTLKNAHRAVYDAGATAQCLILMIKAAQEKGAQTLKDINDLITGYNRNARHHITLLVSSQEGIRNINRLVSLSHLKYFFHEPMLPRDQIQKYREGLIIGSGCFYGELFQGALNGEPEEALELKAAFYDFIEVQPETNYAPLIKSGKILDAEQLRAVNQTLIALGDKLHIPVAATGDVHFLDPQDGIFRAIIHNGIPGSSNDCDNQPPLYLKTTEEMLAEFAWLGEDKAREIVIDNPCLIADRIGDLLLYPVHPENKTTFAPVWEHAADEIRLMAETNAKVRYGSPLPPLIRERVNKELKAIIGFGYATLYSIAQKLVKKSQDDGYMVGSRGSVGSSFVASLCGITEVNPLPPHYLCEECKSVDFDVPKTCQVGIDLPGKNCPSCGKPLRKDGYDIPFEVFLGFEGDKVPDIDLNFCSEYQATAHAYIEELFGKGYVFRAGTIGTLKDKTAFGLVLKYLEERNLTVSPAEKNRLAQGCIGVKRTTGQHPGGMVILPKTYEINQFTAIQHPANDMESHAITTHYDFSSMHDILVKVDVLGHDDPMMIRRMEDDSGIRYTNIPLDDEKVLSLFRSPEALGCTQETLGCSTGTLGIPEFGTPFVRGILEETQPDTMADLVRISGLSHGTDVWSGNARELILQKTASLRECICTREDIMTTLMDMGLTSKMSFDVMESVRKGKKLSARMEKEMREHQVPDWFIKSCQKIAYMFPKGHAVAYVIMALRVGWFKVYKPLIYYAAYFSIRGYAFNALTMLKEPERIREDLNALKRLEQQSLSEKNKDEIVTLESIYEMALRGFSFLPVDLYKSDVKKFLIEGEQLRCPFVALSGFGEGAAQAIVDARDGGFVSTEDLKNKTKISSACVELLRESGALNGLSDTNQISFFSII